MSFCTGRSMGQRANRMRYSTDREWWITCQASYHESDELREEKKPGKHCKLRRVCVTQK